MAICKNSATWATVKRFFIIFYFLCVFISYVLLPARRKKAGQVNSLSGLDSFFAREFCPRRSSCLLPCYRHVFRKRRSNIRVVNCSQRNCVGAAFSIFNVYNTAFRGLAVAEGPCHRPDFAVCIGTFCNKVSILRCRVRRRCFCS